MDNMFYKIRLKRNEFEVELQGDKEWVEKRFEELVPKNEKMSIEENRTNDLPETLGEFLGEKGNPKKHTDIVAVFAYWLFNKQDMQSFNVKDIVDCYDRTRITKPANPNTIINAIVAAHLFAVASEKKDGLKAWIITRTGEDCVNQLK